MRDLTSNDGGIMREKTKVLPVNGGHLLVDCVPFLHHIKSPYMTIFNAKLLNQGFSGGSVWQKVLRKGSIL